MALAMPSIFFARIFRLERGADGQAEGLTRLAQRVDPVVKLQRLLVAVKTGSGVREEALELLRAHRQRRRKILVETQRVVGVEEPERRVHDRQDDLQLGAV